MNNGNAAQEVVKAIYFKMVDIVAKYHVYDSLFRNEDSLKILGEYDYGVMAIFQEALVNDLMAGMFRLIDPKESCGSENMSFRYLEELVELNDDVKIIIDDMYRIKKKVEGYRHKVLMHNDAKVVLGKSEQDVRFEWEKLSQLVKMGRSAVSKIYKSMFDMDVEFVPVNVNPDCFLRALEARL